MWHIFDALVTCLPSYLLSAVVCLSSTFFSITWYLQYFQRFSAVCHCGCSVKTVYKNSWTSQARFLLRKLTKASGRLLERKVLCLYSFFYNSDGTVTGGWCDFKTEVVSDRYSNFWNYRYQISKQWHGQCCGSCIYSVYSIMHNNNVLVIVLLRFLKFQWQ